MSEDTTPAIVGETIQIKCRTVAQAFNEWMRRYTDEPERFAREFKVCGEFLDEVAHGEEPSYGERCAAYLAGLMVEETAISGVVSALGGIYPEGARAYREDNSEVKVGDLVRVGEKLFIKIEGDIMYPEPSGYSIATKVP